MENIGSGANLGGARRGCDPQDSQNNYSWIEYNVHRWMYMLLNSDESSKYVSRVQV